MEERYSHVMLHWLEKHSRATVNRHLIKQSNVISSCHKHTHVPVLDYRTKTVYKINKLIYKHLAVDVVGWFYVQVTYSCACHGCCLYFTDELLWRFMYRCQHLCFGYQQSWWFDPLPSYWSNDRLVVHSACPDSHVRPWLSSFSACPARVRHAILCSVRDRKAVLRVLSISVMLFYMCCRFSSCYSVWVRCGWHGLNVRLWSVLNIVMMFSKLFHQKWLTSKLVRI